MVLQLSQLLLIISEGLQDLYFSVDLIAQNNYITNYVTQFLYLYI